MMAPAPLARIRSALRALPSQNPAWPSDALMLLADAAREAAIHCEIGGQTSAAATLADIAEQARALAPLFAPATSPAEQLALAELSLRTEGNP